MARAESIALGGYYPTPNHLLPLIAKTLDTAANAEYNIADPCAGEGTAIVTLAQTAFAESLSRTTIHACELETTRAATLLQNITESGAQYQSRTNVLQGDAFRILLKTDPFLGFLYLNPPYDLDPLHGRLEERFLNRFTRTLVEGGVLAFVVPHYALLASARTLAVEYEDLSCFVFPETDFAAYKQVVLFASKTAARMDPEPSILKQVEAWAASTAGMPVLGTTDKLYTPAQRGYYYGGSASWTIQEFDFHGLLKKCRPWRQTVRMGSLGLVPHIMPELPVEDLLFRTYPVATAPRPAHIAAGIASGIFNGRRVQPNAPGRPDLLVKGVFDREYVTIEEKTNKDGDVTSVVQVQQPKLVTTVLDLSTKKYITLGEKSANNLTIEGLLEHYGQSLMGVMGQQCPVLYDAINSDVQLAPVKRPLFQAHVHAARASVMLLGGQHAKKKDRKYRTVVLLGEIGSGKTSVALATANTIAKRVLVMCPPHLLESWSKEVQHVVPHAEVRILQNVHDVDNLDTVPKDKLLIAVLSRETAKLGHGWQSVTGSCPKCGAVLPEGDLAKKRTHCEAQTVTTKGKLARAASKYCLSVAKFFPEDGRIRSIFRGRMMTRYLEKLAAVKPLPEWTHFDPKWVEETLEITARYILKDPTEAMSKLFGKLCLADYNADRIEKYVLRFMASDTYYVQEVGRGLAMLLPEDSEQRARVTATLDSNQRGGYYSNIPSSYHYARQSYGHGTRVGQIRWHETFVSLDELVPESVELAKAILVAITSVANFGLTEECGEPLFQAIPEPRRVALANYIAKYRPHLFDLFLLDEGHEYANGDSAQGIAGHKIIALGIPTILMTGSIMNGYASSLFHNMWSLSPHFRSEFERTDQQRFIDRYGYRKRVLSEKDRESGEVVAFGSMSDRVERSERITGDAPGILPLFLFRHLLQNAVTIHKADLAIDIPPCRVQRHFIQADPELQGSYESLKTALKTQIKRDRFKPDFAGKLFGALSELGSYLDRSTEDTGNNDNGTYEIRYPESVGGELVATGHTFPAGKLSAKEEWMIQTLQKELEEGRNVMVFGWHISILPRLSRIIYEATGEEAVILYADKVPTAKRQEWIEKNIVKKGRRVMVANPVCIQTGLNNLVHFSSEIWMENPACNPITWRQAIGRVDRIGQKHETRIHMPVFQNTLQEQMYDLLMMKVAVSTSADGLDNESMLAMSGAQLGLSSAGLSIGRQLWAMLNEED